MMMTTTIDARMARVLLPGAFLMISSQQQRTACNEGCDNISTALSQAFQNPLRCLAAHADTIRNSNSFVGIAYQI